MFKTNTYSEYLLSDLSLSLEELEQLHFLMIKEIGNDEDAIELYQDILSQALKYFQYRVNWALWSREEKISKDDYRTSCHDALIVNFNVFARYMKSKGHSTEWRDALGDETVFPYTRKRIGDFACYLAFVNALNER